MNFFDLFPGRDHLLAAHRGARTRRPENTLCALEAAVGVGDFVEIDVRVSRDGVPVVIHDPTLRRTTNVADLECFAVRKPWLVRDFDAAELNRLDFGSWFRPDDPFGVRRRRKHRSAQAPFSQSLLTLEGALDFVNERNVPLNIEIKDLSGTIQDDQVVARVLQQVRERGLEQRVLISSFKQDYLRRSRRIEPRVSTALIRKWKRLRKPVPYLRDLGVCALHVADGIVDPLLVAALAEAAIHVNVFTVNDPARREQLYGYGVKAVFTDNL